jgi:hypothetical protein
VINFAKEKLPTIEISSGIHFHKLPDSRQLPHFRFHAQSTSQYQKYVIGKRTNSNTFRSPIWSHLRSPSSLWRSPVSWAELVCAGRLAEAELLLARKEEVLMAHRFSWRCYPSPRRVHGRYYPKHYSQRQGPRYELSIIFYTVTLFGRIYLLWSDNLQFEEL